MCLMNCLRWVTCILLLAVTPQLSAQRTAHPTKKIVLIPGHDSHDPGDHEYWGGCTLLAKWINCSVPNAVAVVTEKGWPKDTTILDDATAIVMYANGGEEHMALPHFEHLRRLMQTGVGLVVLHFAVEVPKETAGPHFQRWLGGYFETFFSVNPVWTASFDRLPKHPALYGVKPFQARDEWYFNIRFIPDKDQITPLLTAVPPQDAVKNITSSHNGNKDAFLAVQNRKPQTLAWAFERPDNGRSIGFTGGHFHKNWQINEFRKTVVNAIAWSAGIDVPENGFDTPTPGLDELKMLEKK